MVLVKKTVSLAVSSALSLMTLVAPSARAGDFENIDVSSAEGESRVLDDARVDHSGSGPAVRVSGSQNQLQGSGYEIHATAGGPSNSVVGVQVAAGGKAQLSNVTITTGGSDFATGATSSGAGSRLILNDVNITTQGHQSSGVVASAGGQAVLSGGSISTSGNQASALSATGKGSVIKASNLTLSSTSSGFSQVVQAQDGASIELEQVDINYQGSSSALSAEGVGSSIGANGVNINASNGRGVGVNSAALTFSNGTINAKGDGITLSGLYQKPGGTAVVSNSRITSQNGIGINVNANQSAADLDNVHITTLGDYGSAIWMPGSNTRVDVKNSILQTSGTQAVAIDNRGGVFSMDGGSIITQGNSAHGLYASPDTSNSPGAEFNVSRVLIETSGRGAVGALARMSGAKISLSNSRIVTHGDLGYGLFASGRGASVQLLDSDVQTAGAQAHGLAISNNATTRLQGATLATSGTDANGIVSYATGAGVVNNVEVTSSHIQTQNGAGILVNGGGLSTRFTDSSLTGRSAGEPGTALWITDRADGVLAGVVQLEAVRSQLVGDVQVDGGSLQLSLADHSSLDGAIRGGSRDTRLSLDDSSAWTLRGDSQLTRLSNNGVVEFADPGLAGAFKQLQVSGDLEGNGHYIMNTDLGREQGDRLIVGGQVTGNNDILVRNSGSEPGAEGQSLTLVQSAGGPGAFSLANRDGVVDAGTYRYGLQADGSGNWNLVNVGRTQPAPGPDNLSTGASAAVNSSAIASLRATWDAERATLVQRLGDLRQGADRQGLWIRGFGQQQSLDNGVGRDFSQRVQGTQLGMDTRIDTAGGALVLGALAGYSQTDRDFKHEGSGKLDSYHVGGYATYLDDSGWYTDTLLTLNRWSTRLDVRGTDGAKVAGHSRSKGAGLSVEAGKQIDLGNRWFVEPQAQVSMLYARSDNYRLDNGLQVQPGEGLSTQIRSGVRAGRYLQLDDGTGLQPYLKAGWVEDLSAQNKVRTNGIASRPDGSGGGWYAGVGINAELSRHHQLYAELETSEGSNIDRPWAANLGYRFSF
ncbi:outer membrane autotransporter barrel domain-containing protein [Pseudomonas saponiphila]|uniref:Outer membrane autotransporter barrel domain-containing protein n=1 Tax=Pseudomonas saponiphila TaxID=556534 RepID=A0A1H4MLN5_9PSED|nr:autotransporter outer membrane beta-barrel domain-containing protein [Pseudomonas saponiphila]SEB83674.1 outer membrane autotransporter barrel domain-containing protein [Pseudomonas saponiphila]